MTDKEILESSMYANTPYIEECKCGYFNKVFTQSDSHPEYHTQVFVRCVNTECKEYVEFNLPVN